MIIIIILPKTVNIKQNAILSLMWCRGGRELSVAPIGIELTKILRFQQKTGSCMEVRLNTPRGKIITNMTNDQVDLTLEDILGASFSEEEMEKLTVAQVKFWLKCRRINRNGNCCKGVRCTSSSGFAQSISCLRCLFSTTSLHSGSDACFHRKFAFSGSRTFKQWKSSLQYIKDLRYIKKSIQRQKVHCSSSLFSVVVTS